MYAQWQSVGLYCLAFLMFFELLIEILGPLLGTVVENAKFKTVLSGIYLHLCDQFKNPSLSMWVFKMHFYKYTFFGIIFVFFFVI